MARRDRMRSRHWHFSYSDERFSNKNRYKASIDPYAISTTFNRKIMRCKRCGSRVVSNVSHCPYCGKNLLPLYRRFWVWMLIVLVIGAGVAALLVHTPTVQPVEEQPPVLLPVVVDAPAGTPYKDLSIGTSIVYNQLNVAVTDSHQEAISSNDLPITAVGVSFFNSGTTPIILYSTQWQMESTDGTRVECFIGKTKDDVSIRSELDTLTLAPASTYSTILYFEVNDPALALFAPNALSYSEDELVSWNLTASQDTPTDNSTDTTATPQ